MMKWTLEYLKTFNNGQKKYTPGSGNIIVTETGLISEDIIAGKFTDITETTDPEYYSVTITF